MQFTEFKNLQNLKIKGVKFKNLQNLKIKGVFSVR